MGTAPKPAGAAGQRGEKKNGGAPGAPRVRGQGPGGVGDMTPDQQQKRRQEFMNRFKSATPAQRKEMLEQLPEAIREQAKQGLKAQGLEIPD